MLTQIEARLMGALNAINPMLYEQAMMMDRKKEWGMPSDERKLLQHTQIMFVWWMLLQWKAVEHNTFYRTFDDDGCPVWKYPKDFKEAELWGQCTWETQPCCDCSPKVQKTGNGWVGWWLCHHIHILPVLQQLNVLPDSVPDGIDYMIIEQAISPCLDNFFQVNKTRNNATP